MDFSIPRSLELVLPTIHELIERDVIPLEPALMSKPFVQLVPRLNELRQQVKQMGLWAPHMPKDLGGLGLNCVEYALVGEELGRSPPGHYIFNAQAPDAGNMEILREFGTPEQRKQWLVPLLAGAVRSCFA